MTIPDLFDRAVARHRLPAAMTHWSPRLERHVSSQDLARRVASFAAGLAAIGLRKGDRVLLIAENRPEWMIADVATMFAGGISVPVYTSLSVPQIGYLLENSGSAVAIASTQALLDRLVAAGSGSQGLQQIIVMDEQAAADDVMHFASIEQMGRDLIARSPDSWRAPAADLRDNDVATIIYTSGTTGPPKGVMVTHRNLVSNIEALCEALPFGPEDVALSFLPLCHIIQRLADYCYLNRGTRVVHVRLEDVSAALTAVRPTTFPGVPRVYEKAHEAILARAAASPAPVRALFREAVSLGREVARLRLNGDRPGAWLALRHALADRTLLRKVRRGLGGRLRYLVSGGAPLGEETLQFFLALGIPIVEGYGLTETAVLSINTPERIVPGSVGRPLRGAEIRLAGDGEVLARGEGIARGYYLDVDRTQESFRDGWFSTGDLGHIDDRGFLRITGRKKDILVTSGGKKISPAAIEQALLSSSLVAQAVVVGDGRKYLSALLVPNRDRLLDRLSRRPGSSDGSMPWEDLLQRADVRDLFAALVEEANRPFSRFEQVKRFALLPHELTQENGELTPTLKIVRRVVVERHADLIDSLYTEGGG